MLKPIKECEWKPQRRVKISKVWNLRQAEINDHYTVFQDWDKERLKRDVDKFIRSMIETEKAEVKIERDPKKRKNYTQNKFLYRKGKNE